jgi:hypothetical protein
MAPLLTIAYLYMASSAEANTVINRTTYLAASSFIPIEGLVRDDADTHVIFLSGNGVLYLQPSEDDWYRLSSTPTNLSSVGASDAETIRVYLPLEAASPLGCADQYQFCDAAIDGLEGCGPLASLRDAIAGAAPLFNTSYAEFTAHAASTERGSEFEYFTRTIYALQSTISGVFRQIGSKGLDSHRQLVNGLQAFLEPNQWQLDVMHIWDISRAAYQAAFVDTAYGPTDPNVLTVHTNYAGPYMSKMCNNQVCFTPYY